jgi:hypothetical protein
MGSTIEVTLTIIALSFWILFPIGMFISVSHVDKNTDQLVRLEKHRHFPEESLARKESRKPVFQPVEFDWHHPIVYFRNWLHHE